MPLMHGFCNQLTKFFVQRERDSTKGCNPLPRVWLQVQNPVANIKGKILDDLIQDHVQEEDKEADRV